MAKKTSLTKTLAEAAFYKAWFANTPESDHDPEVYHRTHERYLPTVLEAKMMWYEG